MDPSSRPGDRPASSSLSPPDAAAAAQPQLSTPVAEGTDNETEYFPPLDETATVEPTLSQQPATATSTAAGAGGNLSRPPSAQGRTSRRRGTSNVSSHSGGGVGGPTASSSSLAPPPMLGESIRQPSIRIRRRTNSSARPRSAAGAAASTDNLSRTASASSTAAVASDPFTGRRRSLSQPERPPTTADTAAANSRQAPRRAPPTAMPRLTEEGTRPTAEELGVPRSAVQPPPPVSQGLRLSGDRTDEDDDVPAGQPGGRLQAMRTWSRLFRPRAQSQSAEDGDGVASEQSRPASGVPPDTYDERLVDYLDTVGE